MTPQVPFYLFLFMLSAYVLLAFAATLLDLVITGKFKIHSPSALIKRLQKFIRLSREEKALKTLRKNSIKSIGKARTVDIKDLTVDDFEITVKRQVTCEGCYFFNNGSSTCSGTGRLRTIADQLYQNYLNNKSILQGVKISTDNIIFVLKPGIDVRY